MSLSLSKEATWTSSHRYIYGIIFFSKGSYSIRPNSSPSDNIAAQIPTADNQRHLLIFFLGCRGRLESCLFLPGLSHIFVGHAPLSPAAVWVSVSSAHVFWARARQEFASVVFGHAFSHTAFQTDLLTSTHFAFFFFSPLSSFLGFFFFFCRRATYSAIRGGRKWSKYFFCLFDCVRSVLPKMYLSKWLCTHYSCWLAGTHEDPLFHSLQTPNRDTIAVMRSFIWRKNPCTWAAAEHKATDSRGKPFLVLWRANVEECYSAGY